jgi:hypothetical protein
MAGRHGFLSNMNKIIRFCFALFTAISLVLLCSCATAPELPVAPASNLPAEITMNKSSRFAPSLMVKLRLENGAEFNCYVDTGSPSSILPKSVELQLGKRIGRSRVRTFDGDIEKENIYSAPKIYLGDTQLVMGERIGVWTNAEGILGMDCLRHYCLQLDFQTRQMRFLKSGETNAVELGKAFPLTSLRYAYIRQDGFFGLKQSPLLVDTGHPLDGVMSSQLVKQALREQKARPVPVRVFGDHKGKTPKLEIVSFPTCVWNGETYTNLIVQAGQPDIIGLRFLARHQVTFDFPEKVMYLKYTGEGMPKVISENKEGPAPKADHRSEQPFVDGEHRP